MELNKQTINVNNLGFTDKLKPCPFCGCRTIEIKGNKKIYAICFICEARTKNLNTINEVVRFWNNRGEINEK